MSDEEIFNRSAERGFIFKGIDRIERRFDELVYEAERKGEDVDKHSIMVKVMQELMQSLEKPSGVSLGTIQDAVDNRKEKDTNNPGD